MLVIFVYTDLWQVKTDAHIFYKHIGKEHLV